jgi:hypothetical protein
MRKTRRPIDSTGESQVQTKTSKSLAFYNFYLSQRVQTHTSTRFKQQRQQKENEVKIKKKTLGEWESPISAKTVGEDTIMLEEPLWDVADLYWIEQRPTEGGRQVCMHICMRPCMHVYACDSVCFVTLCSFFLKTCLFVR